MKTIEKSESFKKETHDLPTKEIVKQIRKDLKEMFGKNFKFGVTSTYNHIEIVAKTGNQEVYTNKYKKVESFEDYQQIRENDRRLTFQPELKEHLETKGLTYTDFGRMFSKGLEKLIQIYNHDKCDLMTDYFDINYYTNISINDYKAS